jgi:hypothetical protein
MDLMKIIVGGDPTHAVADGESRRARAISVGLSSQRGDAIQGGSSYGRLESARWRGRRNPGGREVESDNPGSMDTSPNRTLNPVAGRALKREQINQGGTR